MAPDVWNWVNEDPVAPAVRVLISESSGQLKCAAQETKATRFKRCLGCLPVCSYTHCRKFVHSLECLLE
jgi:hypothetical protein